MPNHHRGPASEIQALDAYVKLVRASDTVEHALSQHISTFGLSWSQFGVLEALHHRGPQCHKELATRLLRSRGNLTLVIHNLEDRGLVARKRDSQDGRQINVSLTEAGAELIGRAFPLHAAQVVRAMSGLSNDELRELGRLCRKLGLAAADRA
jgi:MarR family transcriptional regulator, 2-MHQ and catechol-resistance regulon repressor